MDLLGLPESGLPRGAASAAKGLNVWAYRGSGEACASAPLAHRF